MRETILYGHHNQMPAHEAILTGDEIRIVAGYVLSLQKPEPVASATTAAVQASR